MKLVVFLLPKRGSMRDFPKYGRISHTSDASRVLEGLLVRRMLEICLLRILISDMWHKFIMSYLWETSQYDFCDFSTKAAGSSKSLVVLHPVIIKEFAPPPSLGPRQSSWATASEASLCYGSNHAFKTTARHCGGWIIALRPFKHWHHARQHNRLHIFTAFSCGHFYRSTLWCRILMADVTSIAHEVHIV